MCYVYRWVNSTAIFFDTKDISYSVPCKYFKGLSWNEVTCYTWAFKRPFVSFQMNGVFSSFSEKNHWLKQWKKNPNEYFKWPVFTQTGKIWTGKNTNPNFSSWVGSTPWHLLSLSLILAMSWDIRYANFRPTRTKSRRCLSKLELLVPSGFLFHCTISHYYIYFWDRAFFNQIMIKDPWSLTDYS